MSGTNRDTLVSCGTCGSETYVNFQVCLQNGWPSHCGYTMRMVTTEADIDKAVAKTIGPKIRASLSDVTHSADCASIKTRGAIGCDCSDKKQSDDR